MKLLVIVPSYPNINSISYQFVHERVKEYKKEFDVDVFCFDSNFENDYIYENVKIIGGNKDKLLLHIKDQNYDAYAFHFLNSKNAKFILKYLKDKKVFIWFHGSDSVSFKRRLPRINYSKLKLLNPIFTLKTLAFIFFSKRRQNFIKKINKNLLSVTFVFVSNWNKNTSEADFKIKYKSYRIIPNYVNKISFPYKKKTISDRLKVLSINNYSNNIYAGDMTQDIILEFSKYKEFQKFTFEIYGKGILFDKYTNKMVQFKNVHVNKRFLNHKEILKIQNKNGIFLYPKRGDSQGVSRCEAMSSGLVPIASNVEAISEFLPKNSGYLVNTIQDFIDTLLFIYKNPEDFLKKSEAASKYVMEKLSYNKTITEEIDMLMKSIK